MKQTKVDSPTLLRPKAVVKGPIRCHKCQLVCRDAEQYLSHACEPREVPVVSVSRGW